MIYIHIIYCNYDKLCTSMFYVYLVGGFNPSEQY